MRGQFGKRGTGGGPGAGVTTFNGRNGNVTGIEADYSAFFIIKPISQTVAEVQAPTGNGTYTEGSWIIVSDNIGGLGGSSGTMFEVGPGGYIVGTGWCRTYLSGAMDDAMGVWIDWDATTDFVSRIFEPKQGNTVTAFYNTAGLTGFPFDTTDIFQANFIDPVSCSINIAANIPYATFEGYNTITIGAGCTFSGKAGREATVTLSDTAIFTGEVGDNGGVTLIGTQALNWCTICANENVDCSTIDAAYTQTGKYIGGGLSTFECSVLIDLNALTELNITQVNATEDYSFCGRFLNVQNSGGAVDIESIISNQTGHEILFILGHSDAISFSTGGGLQTKNGATINLTTLGSTFGVMYNDVISKFMENGNTLII